MTQPDRITGSPTPLKSISSRSDEPRGDGQSLTEKPEGSRPSRLPRPPASRCARTQPERASQRARPKGRPEHSKKAILERLLCRKSGATMQAMMDATSWQAHSLRAALSGLRKSGTTIERRANRKGESVYAIVVADQT